MRKIAALLLATISLSVAHATGAVTRDDALVIRAKHSVVVPIEFDRAIKLKPREMSVTLDGGFAGYVLTSHKGGSLVSGAITLTALEKSKGLFGPAVVASRKAKPGKYLLHIVTDGRAEIRIPAANLTRTLTVTGETPLKVKSDLTEFGIMPPHEQRLGVRVTRNSFGIALLYQEVDHHQASVAQQCLTDTGGQECLVGASSGGTFPVFSPGQTVRAYVMSYAVLAPWSWLESGRYDVLNRLTSVSGGGTRIGLALMFPLAS